MSHCNKTGAQLETFLDGELPPDKVVETEQHLSECSYCLERLRFEEAVRATLRKTVHQSCSISSDFETRLQAALRAERDRQAHSARILPWPVILPLAAAALLVLLWGKWTPPSEANPPVRRSIQAASANEFQPVEDLLQALVDHHVRPVTPEITEPSLVHQLEPEVGVPVRLPSLQSYGARWEGGSLVPVNNRSAASLHYHLGAHRVTIYVYDATRLPLRARLEPRVVNNLPVYVGTRRGYSIAAVERRGVGYAVATDLDDRESAELVAATLR